ncbi:MAG: hypothetical protein R3F37_05270 [Candidatus Competibacteraceae bacterium]
MQRLIEDLLDFNQILSRTLQLNPKPVHLAVLIAQVNPAAGRKTRSLHLKVELASV